MNNPMQDIMDELEKFDNELKEGEKNGRWSYRSGHMTHSYKINDLMNTIIKHERKNNELCLKYYKRQEDNTHMRDIARYFIEVYELDIRKNDDNIKLQKLLFFAWLIHYYTNKEYLFETEFVAYEHGPGLPELEEARLKYNDNEESCKIHKTANKAVLLYHEHPGCIDDMNQRYHEIIKGHEKDVAKE